MPINVKKALLKANTLIKRGDPDAAAQIYRDVLETYPQNRQAIQGLADLNRSGRAPRSPAPGPSREQMSQLLALYQTRRLEQALVQATRLAGQFPEDPVIHNFLGVVELGMGRVDEALQYCRKAVSLFPDYGEALCNMGVALQQLGRQQEAADCYTRAVKAEPDNGNAHFGLGSAQRELGKQREAIASYRRVTELQPDNAAAFNNLGNALQYEGRYREATQAFMQGIKLNPQNAEGHYNLGHALFELDRYPEAIASYRAALAANPELDDARAKLFHSQALLCDWSEREEAMSRLPEMGLGSEVVSPFDTLAADGDPARQLQRARRYASKHYGKLQELPVPNPPASRPEKLRVGYFSADFYNHATMYLMIRMFELHASDRFSVHAYSYGREHDDDMGRRLKAAVDDFTDVRAMGEQAVAELARSDQIDIAVDLKGYTQNGRVGIFAHRAAPVQISYLGYPGTLGLPAMDYLLADPTVIPEAEREHYSEAVIYLPNSYQVNDSGREIAAHCPSRSEAGLPESGFVFCCFNNSYKITPVEFDIWMRLLREVDGSVLWLIAGNGHVESNLRREARDRGVDPSRLVFAAKLPLPEHLARHRLADLFLDTFNYNAHTTASDALWAGLPVLTMPGRCFASRVGGSLLNAVGLEELIAEDAADYAALARALARDPGRLSALRRKLEQQRLRAPLFDTARFTRDVEAAYEQAYGRYLRGEAPETFSVASEGSGP